MSIHTAIENYLRRIKRYPTNSDKVYEKVKLCEYLLKQDNIPSEYKHIIKKLILDWCLEDVFLPYAIEYGKQLFGTLFVYNIEDLWKKQQQKIPCLTGELCERRFNDIQNASYHFCFIKV